MNLLECMVTKILSEPYLMFDKWFLKVEYSSYGVNGKTTLMFDSFEIANKINIGHEFFN